MLGPGVEDEEMQRVLAASLMDAKQHQEQQQAAAGSSGLPLAERKVSGEDAKGGGPSFFPGGGSGGGLGGMSAAEQDQLTISQMNEIVASIASSQAMVGAKVAVSDLRSEYADNPRAGFGAGIDALSRKYGAMRRVRKDGNCFYRGFLYRYLESLVQQQLKQQEEEGSLSAPCAELKRVRAVIADSKRLLVSVGYEESAMDMFWEMLVELLDEVPTLTLEALHAKLNDESGVSNHVVWFCRALTATQLKLNVDKFAPFIMDENGVIDVDTFCRTEVEPVNHECEQVQIIALTEMLNVPVAIEYLDGTSPNPSCIVFPDAAQPTVKLLYRPGHYDILYDDDDDHPHPA